MATKHAQLSNWDSQLLPNIVDHLSKISPEAAYARYPILPTSYSAGYRTITYRDLANAVNGVAWWLHNTLGPGENFEVLTYIGPNDVRYIAFILAAVKCGYTAFLTSPRNSMFAHGELLKSVNCRTFISPSPVSPLVESIVNAHKLKHVAIPPVVDLLEKEHPHFPYNKTFENAQFEPLCTFHSSGSTGVPKPLTYTHQTAMLNIRMLAADPPPVSKSLDRMHHGREVLNAFPCFHGAGLGSHLFHAIPFGTVMIAPLAEGIVTADGLVQALQHTTAKVGFFVPALLHEFSQKPELLDICASKLDLILYCGGDLPTKVGDVIASKVLLACQYGASEIGLTPQLLPPEANRGDWQYVRFPPWLGFEFREATEGLYEMWVKKSPERTATQPTFTILPSLHKLQEYDSHDLFSPHPTIPNFWRWRARSDDIIVFLNGEKLNPISMEQHIVASNPEISAALVLGIKRLEAALLIEPAASLGKMTTSEEAAFIEKIWPSVEQANRVAPAHARVEKAFILLTSPEKPMPRAGKGTVQRAATLNMYRNAIDNLYQNVDKMLNPAHAVAANGLRLSPELIKRAVKDAIAAIFTQTSYQDSDNLFLLGMDSLQSLQIIRRLRSSISLPDFGLSTFYSNPSIDQLVQAIMESYSAVKKSEEISRASRDDLINRLLDEYRGQIQGIPVPLRTDASENQNGHIVVLTGSTGSLGSYLLNALLQPNSGVKEIYCLNRRPDGGLAAYQTQTHSTTQNALDRVKFLQSDLSKANLGLESDLYEELRSKVTLILHNAWPVDFNLSLPSFQPHLQGLVNLFALSASSASLSGLFFISSISSIAGLSNTQKEKIPEVITDSFDAPFSNGYAESKFIAEKLCNYATKILKIPTAVARVGQIAGPVQTSEGIWNPTEWLPSLIMSSVHIGSLPDSVGPSMNEVEWLPIDLLADVIIELACKPAHKLDSESAEVYHLVNPHAVSWKSLLPAFTAGLQSLHHGTTALEVVPSHEWLAKLRQDLEDIMQSKDEAGADAALRLNPAVKLLDFYRANMLDREERYGLACVQAVARSPSLREMPAVGEDWVKRWIDEWMAAGKFNQG